jgi:hypothetical protein
MTLVLILFSNKRETPRDEPVTSFGLLFTFLLPAWYEIVRAISFNAGRISLYAGQISFNPGTHKRSCGFRHKVKSAY